MNPISHRAGASFRTFRRALAVLLASVLAAPHGLADAAYFENPPKADWGVLLPLGFACRHMAVTPDGGVVMLGQQLDGDGSPTWPGVVRIAGDSGAVVDSQFYPDLWPYTFPEQITPVLNGAGALDGFLFVGGKTYELAGLYPTWMWLVRINLALDFQWESLTGRLEETGDAYALAPRGSGFLVGGRNAFLAGGGYHGWFGEFSAAGDVVEDYVDGVYAFEVNNIEPASSGGFVFATERGVEMRDDDLDLVWMSAGHPGEGIWDEYRSAKEAAAGHLYGLADRNGNEGQVVTRFAADGEVDWSVFFPSADATHAADVAPMADGGGLVVGTKDDGLNGGTDLWLLKLGADGSHVWEMSLGQEGDDRGTGIVTLPDGSFAVAGSATVDGAHRTWVFKIGGDVQPAGAAFTMTPISPVFRDQEVHLDASGSTAPPGDPIASYHWNFGDGSLPVVTTEPDLSHTYRSAGTYLVTLDVLTEGSVVSKFEADVGVIGLAVQWERFFGHHETDVVNAFVEARDGGYVLAGNNNTSYIIHNHMWVFKTDARGRPDWESYFDSEPPDSGSEQGRSIVRAHDEGYLIGGTARVFESWWEADAVLQQVDEDGNAIGPMRRIGATDVSESLHCLIATDGGGYAFLGTSPYEATNAPWLVEVAADGTVTERFYPYTHSLEGNWLTPRSGGGYALAADGYGSANCVIITDAAGAELGIQETNQYSDQNWIGPTSVVPGGFIVVGRQDKDIALRFHDSEGADAGLIRWSGSKDGGTNTGKHATVTPEGGLLITGDVTMEGNSNYAPYDLALIKTDAEGATHWMDTHGSPEASEFGLASMALEDGSIVVLGRLNAGDSRCWFFKVAANHPPVADLQVGSPLGMMGASLSFDATGSTDRDGSVVLYEWDFGDGPAEGPGVMDHAYDDPGAHDVQVTVVDDDDGEDIASMTVFILGARVIGDHAESFVIEEQSRSEDPGSEPDIYPKPDSPPLLDWANAVGFHLVGTASSSTTRPFRVTFAQVLSPEFIMFRLPDWTPVPFTLIDEHTVEVNAHSGFGETEYTYVFSGTLPPPEEPRIEVLPDAKFLLTFATLPGLPYRILHSEDLDPEGWSVADFGLTLGGPFDQEVLTGLGGEVTVYLEQPGSESFYRLQLGEK